MASLSFLSTSAVGDHPYLSALLTACLICVVTYISTYIRFLFEVSHLEKSSVPTSPPQLPLMFPGFGHLPSLLASGSLQRYMTARARSYPQLPAFAISLGGSRHNVVTSPSMSRLILTSPKITPKLHMRPLVFWLVAHFWGDKSLPEKDQTFIWETSHAILRGMMRASFLGPALNSVTINVTNQVFNLVSFNVSPVDMSQWERSSKVTSSDESGSDRHCAEGSLFPLIRDFVSHITTNVMMGPDFLANYPNMIEDMWTLDGAFSLMSSGIPLPPFHPAILSRNRIKAAIREHHQALVKFHKGEDPGVMWANVDQTSTTMTERALAYAQNDQMHPHDVGAADGGVLWASILNAGPLVFWMIFYIYSTPGLLEEIRTEIAPHVEVEPPLKEMPTAQPVMHLDLEGLKKHAISLQAIFLECLRTEGATISYKYVEEDFVASETPEDAEIYRKDSRPITHLFRKGEYICMPGFAHGSDGRYFPEPSKFDHRRFLTADEEQSTGSKLGNPSVDYKTLLPWGGGKEICKGKTFAEGEVLLFVAAIVSVWDIEPLSDSSPFVDLLSTVTNQVEKKGEWKHPGRKVDAGATKPIQDLRVKMKRRKV